jgi:hypothetical protein
VKATAAVDFNIGVGAPVPAVLTPQSSVAYLVTVTSSNGQTGCASLSLNASGLPAGVTYSFSSPQGCLTGTESTATTPISWNLK